MSDDDDDESNTVIRTVQTPSWNPFSLHHTVQLCFCESLTCSHSIIHFHAVTGYVNLFQLCYNDHHLKNQLLDKSLSLRNECAYFIKKTWWCGACLWKYFRISLHWTATDAKKDIFAASSLSSQSVSTVAPVTVKVATFDIIFSDHKQNSLTFPWGADLLQSPNFPVQWEPCQS